MFLRRSGSNHRIWEAAQKAGWVEQGAPYPLRGCYVYSPGAFRRYELSLPVYRCDQREDHIYDKHGLRLHCGDAEQNPARESFLRQRLQGACVCMCSVSHALVKPGWESK